MSWRDPEWRQAQLKCEGHQAGYDGGNGPMLDAFQCSCGWRSAVYFDGSVYAEEEAQRHIADHKEKRSVQNPD